MSCLQILQRVIASLILYIQKLSVGKFYDDLWQLWITLRVKNHVQKTSTYENKEVLLIKTSKADIMETDKPINMHRKYLFSIFDVAFLYMLYCFLCYRWWSIKTYLADFYLPFVMNAIKCTFVKRVIDITIDYFKVK